MSPAELGRAQAWPVVVVGGGQAGLATSACLARRGVEHVVLERAEVAWEWKHRRWDNFCLVTPNWQCQLPGFPYRGDDPDGFMLRDEVVAYVEAFAAHIEAPLVTGVTVNGLDRHLDGDLLVTTDHGTLRARQVVVATGPYHHPVIPRLAASLPEHLHQLHSSGYRNAGALPPGDVLVVGTGQSGCQIAEDLHLEGRQVHLATGSAPRVARRYRGRDCVAWLDDMGHYRKTVDEHPLGPAVRDNINHYVTGRGGGHDIDLRAFALEGMALYGRLLGVDGGTARFADDLAAHLDHADHVMEGIKDAIDTYIAERDIDAAVEARYTPVWEPPAGERTLDLATVGSVVWATGFRPDHRWIHLPVLGADGRPDHDWGVSRQRGVYFVGLPWLHTWGSGRFSGVAADAEHVAEVIAAADHARRLRLAG
jgi:putative flavoprotein involved in K+ transport